ncbi:Uncharacterized protein Rs2_10491 [Raphanus sativus]|uniref:Uncharacterized protein LOC108846013 isoform X1 n=1 Tax=Raphanus sativus TaxID=3726 RepID=A0A9W3DBZ4_RAPSA|nr:uncharacterized protein LOC108846013 isoform X1 [Raphanus sativus]KAJ4906833.1 Uncharacterized protein Rs2_10491 [Raphanus sativus]
MLQPLAIPLMKLVWMKTSETESEGRLSTFIFNTLKHHHMDTAQNGARSGDLNNQIRRSKPTMEFQDFVGDEYSEGIFCSSFLPVGSTKLLLLYEILWISTCKKICRLADVLQPSRSLILESEHGGELTDVDMFLLRYLIIRVGVFGDVCNEKR